MQRQSKGETLVGMESKQQGERRKRWWHLAKRSLVQVVPTVGPSVYHPRCSAANSWPQTGQLTGCTSRPAANKKRGTDFASHFPGVASVLKGRLAANYR